MARAPLWVLLLGSYCAALTSAALGGGAAEVALRAGKDEPSEDERPTRQPPTRAMDAQQCALMALPEVINLLPLQTSFFSRSGAWKDKDGAEMLHWEQDRFRYHYLITDFAVDLQPFFSARVLYNAEVELEHIGVALPPPRKDVKAHHITTIVYEDCTHTLMYISRELGRRNFEIFNHLGQFLAEGGESEIVKKNIYFKDEKGLAFAIAGTPTIQEALTDKRSLEWRHNTDDPYDFNAWQVWFMNGFNSLSTLKEPDRRWVVAAVIQEHAIINAMRVKVTDVIRVPLPYCAFMTLNVVFFIGMICLIGYACSRIFLMIYPPKKISHDNPFLKMEIGGHPYGSFALAHGGGGGGHGGGGGGVGGHGHH